MKIQVISQSFYPDHSGIFIYSSDFAFYAAEQGHDVEVITGFPFYPQWKKRPEDRRKILSKEIIRKVKVLRGYIYVPKNTSTFKRVLHEISLLCSLSLNYLRAKKPDAIVVFTTPILLGYFAAVLKRLYACKLIINVQDFQLEAASSLGMTKHNIMFSILSRFENSSYKHADLVTTISHSMYDILRFKKKLDEKKIKLWPNWIQKNEFVLNPEDKGKFRLIHGIKATDKVIAYAGNVGLKQGLETLIDLADELKNHLEIKFFLIGEGTALKSLTEYAKAKNLNNLFFLPLFNPVEYKNFLNDLDIFFLPQKKTEFDVYFPSKLLGLMAAKKIILLSADKDSELFKTIKTHNVGLVTEFGDINALQASVKEILLDAEKQNEITMNASVFVSQFERKPVLDQILKEIGKL